MNNDLYEFCLSYNIYCLLFNSMIILALFPPVKFVAYITPGERSSGSIGHNYLSRNRKMIKMNGRGKGFQFMASTRHAIIYPPVVGDKSMSLICFWTTAKGNLPHLYYILCKP